MLLRRLTQTLRSEQGASFGASALVHGAVIATIILALRAGGGGGSQATLDTIEATFSPPPPAPAAEVRAPEPREAELEPELDFDLELPTMGSVLVPPASVRSAADPSPGPHWNIQGVALHRPRTFGSLAPAAAPAPAIHRGPAEDKNPAAPKDSARRIIGDPGPGPAAAYTPPLPRTGACPPPVYPRSAQRRRLTGTVVLDIDVAKDGSVTDVRIHSSSGHAVLDERALETVRGWRFNPARRGNRPCDGFVRRPIEFKLARRS